MVYVNGKQKYLPGPYNSPESKEAYRRFVAEWATGVTTEARPTFPVIIAPPAPLTVAEALVQYKAHAESYYKDSREVDNLREALAPIREQFGLQPLANFGPLELRTVRDRWVAQGLARNTINARIIRVKRFFRWAASHELIGVDVVTRLDMVESLMPGRGGKETRPKKPVPWDVVEATLPHLTEMVRAMVLFGWHAGARPSEICNLTTEMIDQAADVWVATLNKHKTDSYGHIREIPIGRTAQNVLTPWLRPNEPGEPIFSPMRVDDHQDKRKGKRLPGRTYSRAAFQQVIRRACRRGKIAEWSPNQLRHSYGSRIRDFGGIESAQIALGHAKPDTTLIYTSHAKQRMLEIIKEMG
jgi:integrase